MTKDVSIKQYGTMKEVWKKKARMTRGKLTEDDLMVNPKTGKIVSKLKSKQSQSNPWIEGLKQARKDLKLTGFVPPKKGSPLYIRAKEIMGEKK